MLLQPFLDAGNDILDIMVTRHRPKIWLIFIGIRVTELIYLVSEVDIWWNIIIASFFVLLNFLDCADAHDSLGSPRSYNKIIIANQNILPVSLPFR